MTMYFLLVLLSVASTHSQSETSFCESLQYRSLSIAVQNEHQCMILEKLQTDFDRETRQIRNQYNDLYSMISNFQNKILKNFESSSTSSRDDSKSIPTLRGIPLVRDCNELYMNNVKVSGVYPIRLPNRKIVNVWCDMDTSFGGWTLIQRRIDGTVNFTRTWEDYAFGFGNANTEYWLGNENLYWLTNYYNFSIRFDLWDWGDNHVYAAYDYFRVESEQMKYQLKIVNYSGTAGDSMIPYHNNMKFSTIDQDNDEWHISCAQKDRAGWWYRACGSASLNGEYVLNNNSDMAADGLVQGILWYKWKKDYRYSLKRAEIKIKPFIQVKIDRLKESVQETKKKVLNEHKNVTVETQNDNVLSTTATAKETVTEEIVEIDESDDSQRF